MSPSNDEPTVAERALARGLFLLYAALRVVGLVRAVVLEDHDSLGYLRDAQAWRSLDPARIAALSPDSTPLYPLATAAVTWLGPGFVVGGRLVSLVASLVLFVAVWRLGRRLVGPRATLVALALLATNPVLIGLSFAVLSEPLYIALVFAGFALLVEPTRLQGTLHPMAAGVLFGAAFLTRTEGIAYVGAIPAFVVARAWLRRRSDPGRSPWQLRWLTVYVLAFAAVAAPQIAAVSGKLGAPAINGRQVWMAMMSADDERSSDARVYGLDHSPNEINLHYLQRHPDAVAALAGSTDPRELLRIVVWNGVELVRERAAELAGWPALVLALVGAAALAVRPARALAIAVLLATGLLGPMLYNVATRHVAIVAPVLALLAGAGAVRVADRLSAARGSGGRTLAIGVVGLVVVTAALDARELDRVLVRPPRSMKEYSPAILVEPAAILRARAAAAGAPPRICARKDYLAWAADGVRLPLPYTDLPGLINYMRANDTELLFVNERLVQRFPFMTQLARDGVPAEFELMWHGRGARDEPLRLYRLRAAPGRP